MLLQIMQSLICQDSLRERENYSENIFHFMELLIRKVVGTTGYPTMDCHTTKDIMLFYNSIKLKTAIDNQPEPF